MATNLKFVLRRKKDIENLVLNKYRYLIDKSYHWRCSDFRKGCRARITTVDNQLTSQVPNHNHEVQNSELTVLKAKHYLSGKLQMETNLPNTLETDVPQARCHLKPQLPVYAHDM